VHPEGGDYLRVSFRGMGNDGFSQGPYSKGNCWTSRSLSERKLLDFKELIRKEIVGEHRTTIKLVAGLAPGEPKLYNNANRACLIIRKLCSMGRNYFDPDAEVAPAVSTYRLKLWPGFVNCVSQLYAYFFYYPTRHAY